MLADESESNSTIRFEPIYLQNELKSRIEIDDEILIFENVSFLFFIIIRFKRKSLIALPIGLNWLKICHFILLIIFKKIYL